MMVFGVSPFTNPAEPQRSCVGVVFRGKPRKARWPWGRLVRATRRGPAKKDLKQRAVAGLCDAQEVSAAKLNYERRELTGEEN